MELTKSVRRFKRLIRMPAALVLFLGLCLGLTAPLAEARSMPRTSPKQNISGRYIVVVLRRRRLPAAALMLKIFH